MKLTTQDGRTLELSNKSKLMLSKSYDIEFVTWSYVGRVNTYYVEAQAERRRGNQAGRVTIKLGEYPTREIAELAQTDLETALAKGAKYHVMLGNKQSAPADDLMGALITADKIMLEASPFGYCLDVGMINGKSNDCTSFGFNPDENGSYSTALNELKTRHQQQLNAVTVPKAMKNYYVAPPKAEKVVTL